MRTGVNAKRWEGHPEPVEIVCRVCATPFKVRLSRRDTAKFCCYTCHQIGVGKNGGAVRALQMKASSKGLAYVKQNGRHLHRIIAEEIIGRPLQDGEVVHHCNGDMLDNRSENIEVLPSQAEHMARHRNELLAARKAKHGY